MSYVPTIMPQPSCSHRRIAMVYRHFLTCRMAHPPSWHSWCASGDMPQRVWQSWVHFCTADAALPVHVLDHVPFQHRLCPCDTGNVGDEHHLLFQCPWIAQVRQQFAAEFVWPAQQSVHAFWSANTLNARLPYFVHELLCAYQQAGQQRRAGS